MPNNESQRNESPRSSRATQNSRSSKINLPINLNEISISEINASGLKKIGLKKTKHKKRYIRN